MAIDIVGSIDGPERSAAEELKRVLTPAISPLAKLTIAVGAKCYGFDLQDIDLLLAGTFGPQGLMLVKPNGESVKLVNIALIVELKDHSGDRVRIEGQHIHVAYKNGWEDATEKAFRQAKTLPAFLKRHHIAPPYIESSLWLRNYDGEIPPAIQNVVTGPFTLEQFGELMLGLREPRGSAGSAYISFARSNDQIREVQGVMTFMAPKVLPTALDRKRYEKIVSGLIDKQKYAERLGRQLLVFRGKAGSGKTFHLLRLAYDLYKRGDRVLFLTFNLALVSDVTRLLVINGLRDTVDQGIVIHPSTRFFKWTAQKWKVWKTSALDSDPAVFPKHTYADSKKALLKLFEGQITEELREEPEVTKNASIFGFDYVMIDEAQDWPEDERDILFHLFGPERLIIADGMDQLLRQDSPCNWTTSYKAKQIVPLPKALRMSSGICQIIATFAESMGETWGQEFNDEILGGKITVVCGEYTNSIHQKIMGAHALSGNKPVDALFCVQSSSSKETSIQGQLLKWGNKVWDGTDPLVREAFPMSPDEYRVVNYQSCRGLEGWTVVCLHLDRYYESLYSRKLSETPPIGMDNNEYAKSLAVQQILIPLTRAIDHLVIQVDGVGLLWDSMRALGTQYPDLVTIVDDRTFRSGLSS